MRDGRTFIAVAALLALCFAAAPSAAQRVNPQRLFELSLDINGQMMQTTVREGQPLKLTLGATDELELIPVVEGRDERRVSLAVYRATATQPGTRRLAERMALTVGTPSTLRSYAGVRIVVDRVRRAPAAAAPRAPSAVRTASR